MSADSTPVEPRRQAPRRLARARVFGSEVQRARVGHWQGDLQRFHEADDLDLRSCENLEERLDGHDDV